MTNPPVMEFVDIKNVKTRNSVQFIFEVPQENAMGYLESLGGMPNNHESKYCAVVRVVLESGVGNET